MNISTFKITQYMTHENFVHQPTPYVQRRINKILAKYPHPSFIY